MYIPMYHILVHNANISGSIYYILTLTFEKKTHKFYAATWAKVNVSIS